jgi:hypothetical protein
MLSRDVSTVWLAAYIKLLKPAYLAVRASDLPLAETPEGGWLFVFADDCFAVGKGLDYVTRLCDTAPSLAFFIDVADPEFFHRHVQTRYPDTEFVLLRPSEAYPASSDERACNLSEVLDLSPTGV